MRGAGSSSKDPGRPLTDCEKERHKTMEKNATILEKLGLPELLNQMREIKKGYTKKGSEHTKGIDMDKEYVPSDEASESEEDSENDNVDNVSTSKGVALNGKKQSAVTMYKNKKLSKCPVMSMNDFLIQQQEQQQQQHLASTCMRLLKLRSRTLKLYLHHFQEQPPKLHNRNSNSNIQTMSMSEFLKQREKQQHNSVVHHSHQVDVQQLDEGMPVQIEQRRRSNRQVAIAQDAIRRASDDQVVIAPSNVLTTEHLNEPKIEDEPIKKHRGPTMLFEVHARKMEDRVVVLFNDKGQPIGPTDKVVNEFSKFLGTIAHDYTWAPLIDTNWSKVPHKDEMWGYVNKYIIPSSAKKWVLQTIRDSWRVFKSRIKRDHYYKYDNNDARWENRPTKVLDSHFKVLLQYWNDSPVQKHKEGRSPSKTRMFEETRKRKEGRTYKHSNNDTLDKIESGLSSSNEDPFDKVMKKECPGRLRLYGRGVCTTNLKRNDVDKLQALAPEFINAIRVGLSEEMQKDFDAHKEKMDVELKVEKDIVANMQKELDSQKAMLDAQKTELDAQKAKVNHLLVQLQKKIPGVTPENIAQAVTLQFTSTSATPLDGSTT
ncbi:LOW QUALITY PROTEIN: hypothetical protein Cgig2_030551 [Carnegiea gigantea]|uniref:Transposase n=1 Tax=Carnegiea gigantea TaxID=171969 RepID=A0A9Q1JI37_9CARY|nr:LOW QUALITY PROTEIN: hypothetical protein Cgig2_030551 [Carnegiea gigantea]